MAVSGTQQDQAKKPVCPGFAAPQSREAPAPPSVVFAVGRVLEARCDGKSVANPTTLDPIGGWADVTGRVELRTRWRRT
jgi:hypothetical protein